MNPLKRFSKWIASADVESDQDFRTPYSEQQVVPDDEDENWRDMQWRLSRQWPFYRPLKNINHSESSEE